MEFLQSKELRIGNLLMYKKGEIIDYCEVKSISGESLSLFINGSLWDGFEISLLSPIPLTEEWLLKFGFKELGDYTFYLGPIKIHHRKRGFVLAKRYSDILFVHSIQNLYFCLTQKELSYDDR